MRTMRDIPGQGRRVQPVGDRRRKRSHSDRLIPPCESGGTMYPASNSRRAAYAGQIRDNRDRRGMETFFAERPVGALRPGDHAWLAFTGGEERERVIGTFVADGLTTEEKVV